MKLSNIENGSLTIEGGANSYPVPLRKIIGELVQSSLVNLRSWLCYSSTRYLTSLLCIWCYKDLPVIISVQIKLYRMYNTQVMFRYF